MNVVVEPGKYVVAVSGGVDSVVLLHLLESQSGLDLIVAHFDHGIRPNSALDAQFVSNLAAKFDLPFASERVELGKDASESTARQARYAFLKRVQTEHSAVAIITAHHQDDLLETAVHNIIRGTGRRGLTSLQSQRGLLRPLLNYPKKQIIDYALQRKLSWQEDTTNHDQRYTRNYIRHRLLVRFDNGSRQQLLALISQMSVLNAEIDDALQGLLAEHGSEQGIERRWFARQSHNVSKEVLALWLRQHGLADYDRKVLERLVVQCKVRSPGTVLDVKRGYVVRVTTDYLSC